MPRREQLEEMLQSDPDDVFLNYALAKAFVSEGDLTGAFQRFDRVIELDPDYVAAYFQKGQALVEAQQPDAARDVLARGIEVAQRTGDTHAMAEMSAFLESL
jgi:predicted Zn-dependent protease